MDDLKIDGEKEAIDKLKWKIWKIEKGEITEFKIDEKIYRLVEEVEKAKIDIQDWFEIQQNKNKPIIENIKNETKICWDCKKELSKEEFHHDKNRKDGLRTQCSSCEYAYQKKRREKLKFIASIKEKECRHCNKIKPIESFAKNKDTKDGHQHWCKDCCNEKGRNLYSLRKKGVTPLSELIIKEEQNVKPDHEIIDGSKPDAIPVTPLPTSIDEHSIDSSVLSNPSKWRKIFGSKEI